MRQMQKTFKKFMKRRTQRTAKREKFLSALRFEALEDRNLLAGDVGVAFAEVAEGEDLGGYVFAPSTLVGGFDGYQSGFSLGKTPLQVAEEYLGANASDFGLTGVDLGSYRVSSQFVSQHTRVTHIALQQQYNGLDVLGSMVNVSVDNDGRVVAAGSSFLPGLGDGGTTDPLMTNAGPIDALATAFSALGLTVTESPTLLQTPSGQNQSTVISDSGVTSQPITAALGYTYNGSGVELTWGFDISTEDAEHAYAAFVSAESGSYLMAIDGVLNAKYNVIAVPDMNPDEGSQQIIEDPADLSVSPFGWHDTNGVAGPEFTDTRGNNAFVQVGGLDARPPNPTGDRAQGGSELEFLDQFNPDLSHSELQNQRSSTTNTFVTLNLTHDILARYGFDEAAGNYQATNYTGLGLPGDAILVDVDDPDLVCNASVMFVPSPAIAADVDGQDVNMELNFCNLTVPGRDSGMDNDIVIHEFGHALLARLIGGPMWMQGSVDDSQIGAMHEGSGDFLALIVGMEATDDPGDAKWDTDWYTGNDTKGVRRQAYSYDQAISGRTFEDWNAEDDPSTAIPNTEVHQAGEIWASMLYDMTWELIFKYGGARDGSAMEIAFNEDLHQAVGRTNAAGADNLLTPTTLTSMLGPDLLDLTTGANNLALQLFIDGMKYTSANPTFTDARDAILHTGA
jgi:hypothetical protein